jgi:hypothetical protein
VGNRGRWAWEGICMLAKARNEHAFSVRACSRHFWCEEWRNKLGNKSGR